MPVQTSTRASAADHLEALRTEATESIGHLLDRSSIHYNDFNDGSAVWFVGWDPHRWSELDAEGQQSMDAALDAVETWRDEAVRVLGVCAARRVDDFEGRFQRLAATVARTDGMWAGGAGTADLETARRSVLRTVAELAKELDAVLPAARDQLVVPDTNALLARPRLHEWTATAPTTVVIVPTVVAELDTLKTRDGAVGEKAQSLIRQLESLERRGDTLVGVPLAGRLRLREMAVQPVVESAPGWLDPDHRDDQLLLAVLHLRASQPRSAVLLLTLDRNLRNKARAARTAVTDFGGAVDAPAPATARPRRASSQEPERPTPGSTPTATPSSS